MNWTNRIIQRPDGFHLYTRCIGEGDPILLIHGAAVDSEFFNDFAQILADHYKVITYDRRGYGYSAKKDPDDGSGLFAEVTDGVEYYIAQAEDAAQVLRTYTQEPAIVLGCSAGAIVAMNLTVEHPELVKELYMHEPPAYILMVQDFPEVWNIVEGIKESIRSKRFNSALNKFILFVTASRESKKELSKHEQETFMDNGLNLVQNEYLFTFSSDLYQKKLPEGLRGKILYGIETGNAPLHTAAQRVSQRLQLPLGTMPGSHNGAREDSEAFAQAFKELLTDKESADLRVIP